GATMNAHFARLLEQPFVEQDVMVLTIFVHIEPQQRSLFRFAAHPCVAQFSNALISQIPTTVMMSEPMTCPAMPIALHSNSLRKSSVVISAENVENVVRPPRKPVVTSSRISGDIIAC